LSEAPTIEPKELVENSGRPAVVVVDLHKSFGALEVLKGVSLAARQGDVVSILGPSGSGKSTMLRCINLLETPDSGTIGVGEETLRFAKNPNGRVSVPDQRQVERLRRSTGMVFQSFNLWSHMTILQNVVEAPIHVLKRPRAECVAEAEALLARVGIADRRHSYPATFRAGSSSARRSRVRSPCGRKCCCSTSRPLRSIQSWSARFSE